MSRALYLVSELFLNEGSCSSSTIINPNLGIFKKNKFTFSYTGIGEECSPEFGGNELRVSRKNANSEKIIYSLIYYFET